MLQQVTSFELEDALDFEFVIEGYDGRLVGKLRTNDVDEKGLPSVKALSATFWTAISNASDQSNTSNSQRA